MILNPSPWRVHLARIVALVADSIQLGFFPVFSEGVFSPFVDMLDVVVSGVMLVLLGWHWRFLPTVVIEVLPVADLLPTWTATVFVVTRGRKPKSEQL